MAEPRPYSSTDFSSNPPTTLATVHPSDLPQQGSHSDSPTSHSHHHHHSQAHAHREHENDLSGWGTAGDRFGGMGQAALGEPEPARPALESSNSFSSTSTGSTGSDSASESDTDDDADEREREEQPAARAYRNEFSERQAQSLGDVKAREGENHEAVGRQRLRQGGQSKSYYGGSGAGYLRMLHALAQDDEETAASSSSRRGKHSFSRRTTPPTSSSQQPPQATYSRNGPPIPNDPSPTSPTAPAPIDSALANSTASLASSATTSSGAERSPEMSHFISPPERAAESHSLARCPSGGAQQHGAIDASVLSSSATSSPGDGKSRRRNKRRGDRQDLSKSTLFALQSSPNPNAHSQSASLASLPEGEAIDSSASSRPQFDRTSTADTTRTDGTSRTVERLARREKLAEKLAEVFGLEEAEQVLAEYPCWLFRSVLLEGFLYVTSGHLCFYAFLAQKEGATIRSGSLSVRGSKMRRYNKHWFVLKDDVLSWFPSSTDPYFPDGHIDLHYCVSVEPSVKNPHHFKVAIASKKWHLSADSEASRDEWVKTLKKVVFRCQNEGESVKIAIPLETVVDVEKSESLEFAETLRVRVYDAEEGYDLDEYWLSYFKDIDGAVSKINDVLDRFRAETGSRPPTPPAVEDTTKKALPALGVSDQHAGVEGERNEDGGDGEGGPQRSKSLGDKLASVFSNTSALTKVGSKSSRTTDGGLSRTSTVETSPRSSIDSSAAAAVKPSPLAGVHQQQQQSNSATPIAGSVATLRPREEEILPPTSPSSSSSAAPAVAPLPTSILTGGPSPLHLGAVSSSSPTAAEAPVVKPAPAPPPLTVEPPAPPHTYPPAPSAASTPPPTGDDASVKRRSSTLSRFLSPATTGGRKILEVVTHRKGASQGSDGKEKVVGGLITEEPEDLMEGETTEEEGVEEGGVGVKADRKTLEMRKTFGLGEKEELIEEIPAWLYRGIPISGKVWITSNFFCFKSGMGLVAKTKMNLPLNDIIGVRKHRSYRIGFAGLMVVIKGHEEVFLELSNADRRDSCMAKLEAQRDLVRQQWREKTQHEGDGGAGAQGPAKKELEALLDLSSSKISDAEPLSKPHPKSEAVAGQPPIMFSSTTSEFVTFRPETSLRFTCLTIGSRGDVQPYIALCKGLMAQGHKCKIASHGEYRKWVEGHGIEFSAVGGDPAELMQLMISHDFFTVSFMKEAVGRFRGWLDDLLASAWEGCQNTDVLIESPSAIAGYHIAEALQVPYYRAFTMPWSRTRAYPHAFAVPEVHMGGGYNYMTYTMFDQVFWRATAGQVNRWRKDLLKLPSTSLDAMQQHKIPFLYNFSPVIIPPPLDWRENIHVTGYWILENPDDSKSKKWEPPQELLDFLDEAKTKEKKVVFIGFGSIIIPDPLEMTRVVAEAVEKAGVYAIVARGWSDRASNKSDSEDDKKEQEQNEQQQAKTMDKPFIHNVKSVPHDWLFPRISAAVHHGGAGTTGASLRAGLPTIIKPFFGDQHFYADRVSTLGIGSHVRNFTVENLAEALVKAVTDATQIERARLAGEEIRKEDGVANAIECIYRDLEYARSLIPPPSSEQTKETANASIEDDNVDGETTTHSSEHVKRNAARPSTPVRVGSTASSSPKNESVTSSDESSSWDHLSRGSVGESRASSRARADSATSAINHDQAEDNPIGGATDGDQAGNEAQSGVAARLGSVFSKVLKSK